MYQCFYLGLDSIKILCFVPHKHSQVNPQPEILLSLALKNNWCTNEFATCLNKVWNLKKKIVWIESQLEPEMSKKPQKTKQQTHSWKVMYVLQTERMLWNSLGRVYSALSIIKTAPKAGWGN